VRGRPLSSASSDPGVRARSARASSSANGCREGLSLAVCRASDVAISQQYYGNCPVTFPPLTTIVRVQRPVDEVSTIRMDFESLYAQYARDVYRFVLYLSGRPDQADDITAETFVRAWMAREPIREGTVKAYLFAIARNLYRADARRSAKVREVPSSMPAAGPSPERAAAASHDLAKLLENLPLLSEIDRAVLLMRAEDDMSYEEIAAAVGISPGAAKVKVHRARARLAALGRKEQS